METTVKKVDFQVDFQNKKIVAIRKNETELIMDYDKLVLATVSTPIIQNVQEIDLKNVQLVKIYQNTVE